MQTVVKMVHVVGSYYAGSGYLSSLLFGGLWKLYKLFTSVAFLFITWQLSNEYNVSVEVKLNVYCVNVTLILTI